MLVKLNLSKLLIYAIVMVTGLVGAANIAKAETLVLGKDVTYTKNLKNTHKFPSEIENILISQRMLMMVGRDGKNAIGSLDLMSRIFITDKFSAAKNPSDKMIVAISGIEIPDAVKYNAVYLHPKGYIVHFKAKSSNVALFFQGYSENAVIETTSKVTKSLGTTKGAKSAFIYNYLLPSAWASDSSAPSAICGGPTQRISSDNSTTNASLLSNTWECTKGVAGGLWDATGGVVEGTWELVKGTANAVIHPIATFNAASESVKKMGLVMSDMGNAFGELKSAYDALPDTVKVKLSCELISSIGVTGAIAYFTAGAGSSILARTIAQSLTKIAGAMPATSAATIKIAALAEQLNAKAVKAIEVEKLIAQGPNGKVLINSLKEVDDAAKNRLEANRAYYAAMEKKGYVEYDGPWAGTTSYSLRADTDSSLDGVRNALYDSIRREISLKQSNPILVGLVENPSKFAPAPSREAIFKELEALQASNKITPAQKAAAIAYVSLAGCQIANNTTSVNVEKSSPSKGVQ